MVQFNDGGHPAPSPKEPRKAKISVTVYKDGMRWNEIETDASNKAQTREPSQSLQPVIEVLGPKCRYLSAVQDVPTADIALL